MSFWNDTAKVCSVETCEDRCTNVTSPDDHTLTCDCSPSCKAWGRCCLDYEAVCEDRKGNWSMTRLENATDIILNRKQSLFDDVNTIERTTFKTIADIYWGRPPYSEWIRGFPDSQLFIVWSSSVLTISRLHLPSMINVNQSPMIY